MKTQMRLMAGVLVAGLAACGGGQQSGEEGELRGTVSSDGSSTVYPVTAAMAEEFGNETGGKVRVTVGQSGTGGGMRRFCAGQIDVANASRPMKDTEKEACAANGVEYILMTVAFDGLSVVVNPQNTAVTCLTTAELKRLWEPGSKVRTWAEVRPGLPSEPIKLYGPGTASGTFDYFTEAVVGKEDASRSDYTQSEDDNVLVQGVAGDRNSLGYFGYAYYVENQDKLKLLQIDDGNGCIAPTPETIKSGEYKPLSRPLLIYISRKSLERPEVRAFMKFYNEHATEIVPEVGYVPMSDAAYQKNISELGTGPGA